MAISVQNTGTATVGTGASVTDVSLPSGAQENDIVLVATTSDIANSSAPTTDAGWTLLFNPGGSSPGAFVFWKRMGATPDTTVPIDEGSSPVVVVMLLIRGVDTTTAIDDTPTSDNNISGMPNAPSFTTTVANTLRIITGHLDDDDEVTGIACSGFTVVSHTPAGGFATTIVGYAAEPTAQALNPDAFSGDGSDAWHACHFALRPAPGGGGTILPQMIQHSM